MSGHRIYVASSWRCERQPEIVQMLRADGHEVYDFRHPPTKSGFGWAQIDPAWQSWDAETFRARLRHPIAAQGFVAGFRAMMWCDVLVLVLPCGRSAHLEAGWAAGTGKRVMVLLDEGSEPELMYLLATDIVTSTRELRRLLTDPTGMCRECGCSEEFPCEGGCFRYEQGLCSRCAGLE